MSQHVLLDRSETGDPVVPAPQFPDRRRGLDRHGRIGAAQAQSRSNIVELQGDALLNGERLLPQQTIQTGDQISTGPGSTLVFVVGNASFKVRQNTQMAVERGDVAQRGQHAAPAGRRGGQCLGPGHDRARSSRRR